MLVCFSLIGCNPFEPRNPETPEEAVPWNSFMTTPAITINNLQYSYEYGQNRYRYNQLFTQNYTFHSDPQDVQDFGIAPTITLNNEYAWFLNMWTYLVEDSTVVIEMSSIAGENDEINSNSAWLYRNYSLTVQHSIPTMQRIYSGKMSLYVVRELTGQWKIQDWYDFRKESIWTWGRLKDAFNL